MMRFLILFLTTLSLVYSNLQAQVKAWEESIVIPTLKVGKPSSHPTFKAEINMRADDDHIYPYPYNSNILSEYESKTYVGCFLENEFIKILVTPEIGGKLYGAIDKTNNYDFFYWQPTVKPALISLTGPWVSGGVEWCYPSGHRHTNYQKIGHRIQENGDGSKTIWVGETEWVHGLRWLVGLTVYPGKNLIEAKVRLMNLTNFPQSQYMWAVAATHADSSYQLIYPTRYMTTHNRAEYTKWPVENGVDLSWWKNVSNASSFFSLDLSDFFGGYDHHLDAGTVFVGNRHIVVGKKFWTWGTSSSGRLWDWVLSDGGGPYVEPQAGAYTTNQPDFHWQNAGEIKYYSQYFFPVRGIGGFKMANEHGALNMEVEGDSVVIGVYATSKLNGAKIRLDHLQQQIFVDTIDIDPANPYKILIPVSDTIVGNYKLSFSTASNETLMSYSAQKETPASKPEPEPIIKPPEHYGTNDEKWKIGEYLYRNRDKSAAERFFRIILDTDSLDERANLSMAQLSIERADYMVAQNYLSKASIRNSDNGQLYFLQGVVNRSLGKEEDAYFAFYRSTHYANYYSAGYEHVACLDLMNRRIEKAMEHLNRALEGNGKNPRLWVLRATALRLKGELEEAELSCLEALEFDPLNPYAISERIIISKLKGRPWKEDQILLNGLLLNDYQYYIDLCLYYIETGLFNEALSSLELFESQNLNNALILYYKSYCLRKLDRKENSVLTLKKAQQAPIENVFPFRQKTIEILSSSLLLDSNDANAHYFLGLIYAGLQNGTMAYSHFLKAAELNPHEPKTWRNLGYLCTGYPGIERNLTRSKEYYSKAFDLATNDDLILFEFDNVRSKLNDHTLSRLLLLKKYREVVEKNDDLLAVMLDLMVMHGEYKAPLEYYNSHLFNNREGKYGIHNSYMNAYIGMARTTKNVERALAYYRKACEYPDNLKVKPREPNLRGFIYYPMAKLYQKIRKLDEAEKLLIVTASEHTDLPTLANYYQACALKELKENDLVIRDLINNLGKEGHDLLQHNKVESYLGHDRETQIALGHFYLSLAHEFRNESKEAQEQRGEAVRHSQDVERVAIMIAQNEFK